MFVEDRFAAPPSGPVELAHDHGAVVELELVDTVFVAVEDDEATRASTPPDLDRVEDVVRGKAVELLGKRVVFEARCWQFDV